MTASLRQALGGGQFQSGPFLFCLFLYADPAFQPNANHPSRMTDVPGVGSAALWVYQGSEVGGRFAESHGVLPGGTQPRAGYDRIRPGDWGGRFGGLVLPKGSRPGDRVHLAIRMSAPVETYGGQISFSEP
ncbi:MAG: hypothetical protein K0R39_1576 [Symbiobacteriaceae bacterium]|nr:hypothetical protein [Symbiobacteriaceae bacterium]